MPKHKIAIEEKILEEVKKIERMESEIKESEEKIADNFASGVKVMAKDGISLSEAGFIRRTVLRKIAKHKFIFTAIVTLGIVLVWRGLWDITSMLPILKDSTISLVIGLLILWMVEKYTEL